MCSAVECWHFKRCIKGSVSCDWPGNQDELEAFPLSMTWVLPHGYAPLCLRVCTCMQLALDCARGLAYLHSRSPQVGQFLAIDALSPYVMSSACAHAQHASRSARPHALLGVCCWAVGHRDAYAHHMSTSWLPSFVAQATQDAQPLCTQCRVESCITCSSTLQLPATRTPQRTESRAAPRSCPCGVPDRCPW